MIIISHRGNLNGPNPLEENCPDYILKAYQLGYDVEVDVWRINEKWCLGHDKPQYEDIHYDFFTKSRMWLHAKNGDAFYALKQDCKCNVFWHTNEDWVITSKGYIWTYPNKYLYPDSICVMPEMGFKGNIKACGGICSDYASKY